MILRATTRPGRKVKDSPVFFLREFDPAIKERIQRRARGRGMKPGEFIARVFAFYEAALADSRLTPFRVDEALKRHGIEGREV